MAEAERIISLSPVSTSPERASVKVGRGSGKGRTVATLSLRLIADLGLHAGQTWDEALAQRVTEAAAYDKALRQAMHRLARRSMSRRTMDRKLADLEYEADTRERVLDRLEELNLIDDQAYGRAVVRDLLARKAAGPRLLRQKLIQKGIDRTLIDSLVAEATENQDDQAQRATDLARRRLRHMQRLDPLSRKRRIYGLLARRGFDSDTIDTAMRALRKDLDQTPE